MKDRKIIRERNYFSFCTSRHLAVVFINFYTPSSGSFNKPQIHFLKQSYAVLKNKEK